MTIRARQPSNFLRCLAFGLFAAAVPACSGDSSGDAGSGGRGQTGSAGNSSSSAGSPSGVAGGPSGVAGSPSGVAGGPSGTAGGPSGAAGSSFGAAGGPAGTAGGPSGAGGTGGTAGNPFGFGGMGGKAAGGSSMGGSSSAGAAGTGAAGHGGSGGSGTCPHVQLKGSDICTIGDSWIQIPGNQVTTLENFMHTAGVIPASDHFDRREVSGSTLSSIIGTYDNKPSNCKILVMDGGGIDLFTTPAGDQAAITPVVQKFKDFLQKVKTDGYVQHIIYSLYPVIPSTRNVNGNMKPGFSAACAASAVDCHLIDLEPLFNGQHFGSDNTHADNAGGVIIGNAWWKAMQENCIAQ